MLLVSSTGEAWTSTLSAPNPAKRGLSPASASFKAPKEPSFSLKLKRIPLVHRAVAAVSDPKGRNYCVLQVSPREALTEVPEVSASRMVEDLGRLLEEAAEYDRVHDTVCVVGTERFPAHSFILATGSEVLRY